MIIPDKLTDPNNCLLYYGFLISKHLKQYGRIKYYTLENFVKKQIIDFSQNLFIAALNFLYTLDKLKYNIEEDSVELIYETK